MTIPIQSIEESVSVSCVIAIVSRAGASYDLIPRDYGVDLTVRRVDSINGKRMDMGGILDCQLKATINWSEDNGHIIYDLDSDTYNKLLYRKANSSIPCLLVLMCLPKNEKNWVCASEDSLIIKKCCYYYSVSGNPTSNKSSKRIRIPRKQLLTPTAISDIIAKIKRGEIT